MTQNANRPSSHRYQVWELAKDEALVKPASAAPAARPGSKLTSILADLDTMMLLYNAGRPMDLAVSSTCKLPSSQSTDCTTKKVSSDSIDFVYAPPSPDAPAPRPPLRVGAPVALNLDEVGSLRGVLTAQNEAGFQVSVNQESRTLVGTKLAHIAVKRGLGVEATGTIKANVPRIELVQKACAFTDYTGTLQKGLIINLTRFDALIRAAAAIVPPLGSRIVLRGPEWHGADVISAFEIGFVVKFCLPIPEHKFSKELVFLDPPK